MERSHFIHLSFVFLVRCFSSSFVSTGKYCGESPIYQQPASGYAERSSNAGKRNLTFIVKWGITERNPNMHPILHRKTPCPCTVKRRLCRTNNIPTVCMDCRSRDWKLEKKERVRYGSDDQGGMENLQRPGGRMLNQSSKSRETKSAC